MSIRIDEVLVPTHRDTVSNARINKQFWRGSADHFRSRKVTT